MSRFKVALVALDSHDVPEWVAPRFVDEGIELVQAECSTSEDLARVAGDADVAWVFGGSKVISAETLPVLERCGGIVRTGSGTDNIPVAEATARGIVVANTPEAHNDEVADHAIALLFAVIRKIAVQDRALRTGVWDADNIPAHHVQGQTLGLVGFGHIARLVAKKLSGFELTVLDYDPFVSADAMAAEGVRAAGLDEVLSESDFVSLHCPLMDETRHLIGQRELRMMKPRAVLINTSRGPVVDEPALVRALAEGWIAAAGLDVFEQEPTPTDNPLLKLDNVVATPHIAGQSDLTPEKQWRLSMESAIDLAKGRWPRSYVNHGVKPRWELTND